MHGNLMSYRTGEPIRPATREERFDSLHAMLDDDGRGLIETDEYGTCYVECKGVVCVDPLYGDSPVPYDGPHDFAQMALECFELDVELVLCDDGWHDETGLVLVLA